jgi:hypothetical protein
VSEVIEHAWRLGGGFDAWTERFSLTTWLTAFEQAGLDPVALASGPGGESSPLPWDHISPGVSQAYLRLERERAVKGLTTADCSFGECTGCGVCGDLDVEMVLAGEGRG